MFRRTCVIWSASAWLQWLNNSAGTTVKVQPCRRDVTAVLEGRYGRAGATLGGAITAAERDRRCVSSREQLRYACPPPDTAGSGAERGGVWALCPVTPSRHNDTVTAVDGSRGAGRATLPPPPVTAADRGRGHQHSAAPDWEVSTSVADSQHAQPLVLVFLRGYFNFGSCCQTIFFRP